MENMQLFEDQPIRTAWNEAEGEWYFSIVDVVRVLTESDNPQTYWRVLKKRLKDEGNETVTNCNALKMKAADGKRRRTDVANTEQLLRIIQSIPSKKAEPFKLWLAQVGKERIDETLDPELIADRLVVTYERKGYTKEWINQRLMLSITKFIERKLFLKVNRDKTVVAHINKVKFLGYGFYIYKGKCRLRLHSKSKTKMKSRLREILNRNKGVSNEARQRKYLQFISGWLQYFKMADMKEILRETDGWIRRRIRAVYWKQWKKVKTRYRMIHRYNISEWKVHELANCRKGPWRAALMLNQILSDKEIASQGYTPMTSYYLQIFEN